MTILGYVTEGTLLTAAIIGVWLCVWEYRLMARKHARIMKLIQLPRMPARDDTEHFEAYQAALRIAVRRHSGRLLELIRG